MKRDTGIIYRALLRWEFWVGMLGYVLLMGLGFGTLGVGDFFESASLILFGLLFGFCGIRIAKKRVAIKR